MNTQELPMQEDQDLELIDGMGAQRARMTKPGTIGTQCKLGQHCAHHGGPSIGDPSPFHCCRCGAEFEAL